ncbi:TSUP family transporter [Streptomyces sp. NPDC059008]|uniref:TSUP family transporter n=1 Tax=Streptomyces sp. NPDC059008 TaxID=3346693 RepID=UPI0036896B1E
MSDLGVVSLGTLVVAALLVGVSKTAVSGVGALSVALFAAVLPARESTGVLLPLLLVGDVLAVRAYREHTDWPALLRLLPSVAAGVLLGAVFVAGTGDDVVRRTIGALLLTIVLHHLWRRRRSRRGRGPGASAAAVLSGGPGAAVEADTGRAAARGTGAGAGGGGYTRTLLRGEHARTLFFGLVAGFATMVANAGGPAMSLYLLSSGFTMLGFLGTGAWFFLLVNLFKLPFSIGLGLLTPDGLALDAVLVCAVPVGALLGRALVRRIDQALFDRLVLVCTAASSLNLLR